MINVEFHCHSIYSRDSLLSISRIIQTCKKNKISKIAITDHNTLLGIQQAIKIAPELIIPGIEILTTEGEILAFYVQKDIPSHLTPEETIARLRDQGAFISISHPFDRYRKGAWEPSTLERIAPLVDSLEIFNSRCIHETDNSLAKEFADKNGIIGMVGSDAHVAWEIGRAKMTLPEFEDSPSLKSALVQAISTTKLSPPWIHLTSLYATWSNKL